MSYENIQSVEKPSLPKSLTVVYHLKDGMQQFAIYDGNGRFVRGTGYSSAMSIYEAIQNFCVPRVAEGGRVTLTAKDETSKRKLIGAQLAAVADGRKTLDLAGRVIKFAI
jgi:hypothetical protein